MNNFNHANDKLNAPHRNSHNNGNQYSDKMHYLKNQLRLLESAYEGFNLANNYSNANIDEALRLEGQTQSVFYIRLFDQALLDLGNFLNEMKNNHNTNIGGK